MEPIVPKYISPSSGNIQKYLCIYVSQKDTEPILGLRTGMARRQKIGKWRLPRLLFAMLTCLWMFPAAAQEALDLNTLSIEQLANLEITSVSKRPEKLGNAAAAIFVITSDDIRRSGANSVPEILRLAPNLQVARLGASSYGISARGFNHHTGTADKLLVLIDGRIVYSPLFSGVFWDAQNLPIADIDRIEVISGPAGAVWGVNAVNGVINIITRKTRDTLGTLVDAGGGSLDNRITLRHGGTLGENATYRVYAMGVRYGHLEKLNGTKANDSWRNTQGGFRVDWAGKDDRITLQGDLYSGSSARLPVQVANGTIGGQNITGSWTRELAGGSSFAAQLSYDNARRDVTSGIRASVDAFNFDTQYNFSFGGGDTAAIGASYRATWDRFVRGPGTVFLSPATRQLEVETIFAQDTFKLASSVDLTLGLRLINDSYTGLEYAPDARLAWHTSDTGLLWAAVSRAVRAPSRFDTDLFNTGSFAGGPNFQSEDLLALETGYRGQISPQVSLSLSAYYNIYSDLRTVEASGPAVFPLVVKNGMRGDTYGVEAWADYALTGWWRLHAGINAITEQLRLSPGSRDIFGVSYAGNDPSYQLQLRSDMDLPHGIQFEFGLRNVDALASPAVPAYVEANANLVWHIVEGIEVSVTGNNLLHDQHQEFINGSLAPLAIPRSVTAGLRLQF